jgi:shikimate kinase
MRRIILVGFMGSGKTTIGKKLAESLHIPFIDSDSLIIQKTGSSINEIFASKGEQAFREMESEVITELFELPDFVLAVGGGLPVIPGMMKRLNQLGTTVYLQVSRQELLRRLLNDRSERPLLKDKTESELMEYINGMCEVREPVYLKSSIAIQKDDLVYQDILNSLNPDQKN